MTVLESIDFGCFACNFLQVFENFHAANHFLDSVRAQQIEINRIKFLTVLTVVTLGPFLCITNGSHTTQIHSGYEIAFGCIFNEIRERQIGSVGVFIMTTHNQRECTDFGRPEQI